MNRIILHSHDLELSLYMIQEISFGKRLCIIVNKSKENSLKLLTFLKISHGLWFSLIIHTYLQLLQSDQLYKRKHDQDRNQRSFSQKL